MTSCPKRYNRFMSVYVFFCPYHLTWSKICTYIYSELNENAGFRLSISLNEKSSNRLGKIQGKRKWKHHKVCCRKIRKLESLLCSVLYLLTPPWWSNHLFLGDGKWGQSVIIWGDNGFGHLLVTLKKWRSLFQKWPSLWSDEQMAMSL